MPFTVLIMRHRLLSLALLGAAMLPLLTACNGPRVIHEAPVLASGDRVAVMDSLVDAERGARRASETAARRTGDSIASLSAATCAPAVCAAVSRGEVILGMTEPQLLAATRTTPDAWTAFPVDASTVFRPGSQLSLPRDAQGTLSSVSVRDGRVVSIVRETRAGVQSVASPVDTGSTVRVRALADAMIREGDDYIAAGDRTRALERYDRALVMRGDDALLNYKVAQLLDQQLRPVEALMRYQKFLLQMELQRIDALGTQNAKLAEAIALAQQRVLVLDRRSR